MLFWEFLCYAPPMRVTRFIFLQHIHPSWCLYASFCGMIAGIALSLIFKFALAPHWFYIFLATITIIVTLYFARPFIVVVAFLAGVVIGSFRTSPIVAGQENFTHLVGTTVTLRGKVVDDPERDSRQSKLHLGELMLVEKSVEISGRVYVTLVGETTEIERSDWITVHGKLGEGFGIYFASLYRPTLEQLERAETGDIFARLKSEFANLVKAYLPSPEADLGLGYLVGLKSGLPDDLADTLRLVGMTHVIVASGTHLGIIVNLTKKLFGKISRFAGLLFSSILIIAFVLIVGFTPSMTRAALVALLGLITGYFGRRFTPLRLLILTATVTLLIEPTHPLNLGWQLSFASFFGIMIVAPSLQTFLYSKKRPPWLASMLLTSFATSLICTPILIYNFGTFSLLSFVANLIILPTLPYAMLAVFLTGCMASFLPLLASLFAKLACLILDVHIWLVNFLSDKTMFIFELPAGDYRFFLIYLPVAFLLFWVHSCNQKAVGSHSKKLTNMV